MAKIPQKAHAEAKKELSKKIYLLVYAGKGKQYPPPPVL